ncbi:PE family protein [Mycobacterium sp.]|uniref:PE family protein n=1 Tax=Mycobacterium sp. TaxID=1785 RepID=UPI003C73C58D
MSYLTAQPVALAFVAANLQAIGATVIAQNAADEVSGLSAAQFLAHAQVYQTVSAQAAAIHEMFVHLLSLTAGPYPATEGAPSADGRGQL